MVWTQDLLCIIAKIFPWSQDKKMQSFFRNLSTYKQIGYSTVQLNFEEKYSTKLCMISLAYYNTVKKFSAMFSLPYCTLPKGLILKSLKDLLCQNEKSHKVSICNKNCVIMAQNFFNCNKFDFTWIFWSRTKGWVWYGAELLYDMVKFWRKYNTKLPMVF